MYNAFVDVSFTSLSSVESPLAAAGLNLSRAVGPVVPQYVKSLMPACVRSPACNGMSVRLVRRIQIDPAAQLTERRKNGGDSGCRGKISLCHRIDLRDDLSCP